ncbi:MAG: LysR family transcriptional regulator [Anaerovoracaceae bacterium]
MIETRLLHYFLAVAREQNITKAAQELFISQSTLSRQMMDLENQLGKQLFIRGKRKVTLTEDGIFLRNRAHEIMKLLENTETALHTDTENLSGDIFIGCGETVAMDTIAGMMAEFHEQYPEVKLHTYSGDADAIMDRIDKGLSDMGLLLGPMRQEKYDYLNLHQKDIYGLLMPGDCELAKQETINIDQLKTLPMILADQTFSGHQDLDWFGEDALNVVATYNLIYNATFLVEHGVGYALCFDRLVNTSGRNLAFRPITPELSVGLYIVTKKYQTFSPAAKAFYGKIKQCRK